MAKRIPPEVLEYLRKMGQAYGSQGGQKAAKTHDGCGAKGPREEGIRRGSPQAHCGQVSQEARSRQEKVTPRGSDCFAQVRGASPEAVI